MYDVVRYVVGSSDLSYFILCGAEDLSIINSQHLLVWSKQWGGKWWKSNK